MCFKYIWTLACNFLILKWFRCPIAARHKICIFCGHGNENASGRSGIIDLLAAYVIYGGQQSKKGESEFKVAT